VLESVGRGVLDVKDGAGLAGRGARSTAGGGGGLGGPEPPPSGLRGRPERDGAEEGSVTYVPKKAGAVWVRAPSFRKCRLVVWPASRASVDDPANRLPVAEVEGPNPAQPSPAKPSQASPASPAKPSQAPHAFL
jgi:hypothetical protein